MATVALGVMSLARCWLHAAEKPRPESVSEGGHCCARYERKDEGGKSQIKRLIGAWIDDGHFTTEERPDAKRTPRKFIVPVFASP